MAITSRAGLKDWCLKRLGHPVIEINVDNDQVEDRIDEALAYYQTFHYDGTEKTFMKHLITQADIDNRYFTVSEDIIGITKIYPPSSSLATINMWDIRYQMMLHDMQSFITGSIANYWITMTHLRMLEMELQGEKPIRFNKATHKLYVDWDWPTDAKLNQYMLAEVSVIVDPGTYTAIWDDRMLKLYAYALIKLQWGNNLKIYSGIQLPGGITLNGQEIYEEALKDIEEIEKDFQSTYRIPGEAFLVG